LIERGAKNIKIFERSAAGMKTPVFIDRPKFVGGQHAPQALDRRHRGARSGLSIKAKCAAFGGVTYQYIGGT
jgi:hypothetical protein